MYIQHQNGKIRDFSIRLASDCFSQNIFYSYNLFSVPSKVPKISSFPSLTLYLDITIDALLKQHNAKVLQFKMFILGEGLEKKESDFAAEVASMIK